MIDTPGPSGDFGAPQMCGLYVGSCRLKMSMRGSDELVPSLQGARPWPPASAAGSAMHAAMWSRLRSVANTSAAISRYMPGSLCCLMRVEA
eukprot:345211-Chlamydomonas_euryale.AAC.1